jgi:hypothetical protein
LGPGPGPDGEPSSFHFSAYELPSIREKFATAFDDLPPAIPGRDDYRLLIAAGTTVPAYSAVGQLAPNGNIEVVQLDIQLGGWPAADDEPDGE